METVSRITRRRWCAVAVLALGLPGLCLADDAPPTEASSPPTAEAAAPDAVNVEHPRVITRLPHGRRPPLTTEAILAERVRLLTLELDLTEAQQKKVHDILVQHGEAIRRVWMDRTLTEGERVPITGAIGEKTADAIRDLLTPKQRDKYNPPRPDTERLKNDGAHDLSKWLDSINRK